MGARGEPGGFAVLLRRLREAAALTQEELAERAGLTGKAIGALERGERRRPYPHTVRALADALTLDPTDRAALTTAARGPSDVPLPAEPGPERVGSRLVGRERERREVVGLLREGGARLVTVTGPGGVGKTSLALEVARSLPGPVTVVELAGVRTVGLVLTTVARAVGLQRPDAGDPVGSLAAHLGDAPHLLVLDNVEHVLAAAPDVAELVDRCPGLAVLATSRAPLRVRVERDYPLGPLAVPGDADVGTVAASPAGRMFAERAGAVDPGFALDERTAADVAAICRRLDGLPLALELAAAHVRFLGPAQLLARLDQAVGSPRSRDLPDRQRTLGATLDWSHELLTRDEQELLRRLAVFAGGFDLAAAEEVAGGSLGTLGGLVEQSLVSPVAGGRFRMLEPVRQYAAARLAAAGEERAVRDRHAAYVAALAARARARLRGHDQPAWLDRLQDEHDNLRAALETLLATDPGAAAELAGNVWLYWALRGHAGEGTTWTDRILAAAGSATDPQVAEAWVAWAGLRYAGGDLDGARAAGAAGVRHAAGHEQLRAEALLLLGSAEAFAGDHAAAREHLADAAAATDDPWTLTHVRASAGMLLLQSGDLAASRAAFAEAERAARATGGPFTLATVLNMRATQALVEDDAATARGALAEAAALAAQVRTLWTLIYTLPALATLAAREGRPADAVRLFAAGERTARTSSLAVGSPIDRQAAEASLAAARAALGDDAFEAAWAAGRDLGPDELAAAIRSL